MKRPIAEFERRSESRFDAAVRRSRRGDQFERPDEPVTSLHRYYGNQGVQRLANVARTELSVSDPDDRYEREAEQIAESVAGSHHGDGEIWQEGRGAMASESESDRRPSARASPILPGPSRGVLGRGRPLPPSMRSTFEQRLGVDLGPVRIHDGPSAAAAARALDARAFTVGRHIAFQADAFDPHTRPGRKLLAHELAHTVQQSGGSATGRPSGAGAASGPPVVQRQPAGVSVRSPAAEEALTQVSTVAGAVAGRPLTHEERDVAESVFAGSVDLSRVRIVAGAPVEWRTVGNTIYVPEDFSIADSAMRQTFVHEMTHVWQYQHGGTGYISRSIAAQIVPMLAGKSRNVAYDYSPTPGTSFFEYNPEQQGLIVENYFAMLRDQSLLAGTGTGAGGTFYSNHLTAGGEWQRLTAAERQREIASELPWHRQRIGELRSVAPRSELQLLEQRAQELIRQPGPTAEGLPEERQLTPLKPILEVRF